MFFILIKKGKDNMIFEKAKIIESDNSKYVTLSIINNNNIEYAFANKLNANKELVDEYKIFTIIDDKIITIEDYSLINKLLPMFQKEIANDLKEILNYK